MTPGQIRSVLILSPESPYPLHGGGQYRTASLLHYFARFAEVDLVLISTEGQKAIDVRLFAEATGLTVNQISALKRAGADFGLTGDSLATTMERLLV